MRHTGQGKPVRQRLGIVIRKIDYEEWRRERDSNPRAPLTGCKLLILHIATKAETARNAELRYTAGTRSLSSVDCRARLIGLCSTAQTRLHFVSDFSPSTGHRFL